jgi:hypothetical protein
MRSIGSFGSFAGVVDCDGGVAVADVAVEGVAADCCAKVKLGETRKINSSTTVALRLNILTSPLVLGIGFKDEPNVRWINNGTAMIKHLAAD